MCKVEECVHRYLNLLPQSSVRPGDCHNPYPGFALPTLFTLYTTRWIMHGMLMKPTSNAMVEGRNGWCFLE